MNCTYVSSFTSVEIEKIEITSCNINDNTITGNTNDGNCPCLIFVREKPLTVKNFYFFRNDFGTIGKITARDSKKKQINISLENCYADFEDTTGKFDENYVTIANCSFSNPILKTFPLRQLQLGHCQGEIPPGPMIITSLFTASEIFKSTKGFSKSNVFSDSEIPFVQGGGNSNESNKLGKGAVIGIVAGAIAAAVAIAAIAAFFLIRKRNMVISSDIDLMSGKQSSITVDNQLNSVMEKDDPFADDF